MANEKNLIPFNKRTESERRKIAKQGGKKSGEVRREKKTMRETIEMLLSLPINEDKCADIEEAKLIIEMSGKNITVVEGIILAQIKKALKGDTTALQRLHDKNNQIESAIASLPCISLLRPNRGAVHELPRIRS